MTIYQTVADRILKQLEAGVVPWRKTWKTGLPRSLATGREYRGINVLMLGSAPYESCYWLTYREAERLGGHVRKGERATTVVYWKWRTSEELRRIMDSGKDASPAQCVPFASAVFNLDQVEGVERPEGTLTASPDRRLELAGQMLDVMPEAPTIAHAITTEPAYSPMRDTITMPHLSQFTGADEYYATLFHELVHSTGHPRRLSRFHRSGFRAKEHYSFEELVAEFGASFLCAFAGIDNTETEQLQASYIEEWSQVFRKDGRVLLRAASAAQKAADYIRGKVIVEESPPAA